MITQIFSSLVGFAIITFLGFVSAKKGVLSDTVCEGLTFIVVKIAVPAAILMSANMELTADSATGLVTAAIFSLSYCMGFIILGNLTGRFLPVDAQRKKAFTLSITFGNIAFLGFPITSLIFGAEGVFYTAIFNLVFTLFIFTYGVSTFAGEDGVSIKLRIIGMIVQPATLATFLMIALYFTQTALPSFASSTLSLLGEMATPLSMIIIGALISKINIFSAFTDWLSYVIVFVKLIFAPFVVLSIFRLLDIDPTTAAVYTVLSAMPPAVMLAVLSSKYKMIPEFFTKTIVLSMILYIATIPIIIFAIERFYPGVFAL